MTNPIICSPGHYCPHGMQHQLVCPAGSYCPRGAASPIACPAGRYTPHTHRSAESDCMACPSGQYAPSFTNGAAVYLRSKYGSAYVRSDQHHHVHYTTWKDISSEWRLYFDGDIRSGARVHLYSPQRRAFLHSSMHHGHNIIWGHRQNHVAWTIHYNGDLRSGTTIRLKSVYRNRYWYSEGHRMHLTTSASDWYGWEIEMQGNSKCHDCPVGSTAPTEHVR